MQSHESPIRYASKLENMTPEAAESEKFRVKLSDLDINQHTNNVRYLQWINDCYDLDFVLKNIPQSVEINYLSESLFNEEVFIKTSADMGPEGYNNHSVIRTNDNKELCRIRIGWKQRQTEE